MERVSPYNDGTGESETDTSSATTADDFGTPAIEGEQAGAHKQGGPLVIEICAGTALLSKCFKDSGFEHLAIDHKSNRFHSYVTVCNVELATDHGWAFLHHIIAHYHVIFIHAAPPCGTCSKAREIPCGPDGGPKQLRSAQYPSGLPHLDSQDLERIQLANALYNGLTKFLTECTLQGIPWSVENPTSSYLWLIPCFADLIANTPSRFYNYDTCAWGSSRKLRRSFLSTLPDMCGIEAQCPGNHEHAPFGRTRQSDGTFKYATSDEAAYTKQLCVQIVSIVQNALQIFPQKVEADATNVAINHKGMIALQKQPSGRRMPPLISEFERFETITAATMPVTDSKGCLTACLQHVPTGSKLLSFAKRGEDESSFVLKFGIYRTPWQWIDRALALKHPFDTFHAVPDQMLDVLSFILTTAPAEVCKFRISKLKLWMSWAEELDAQEKEHKEQLDPEVGKILAPKRLLLLRRIADSLGWPDTSLFDEIDQGFKLTGIQSPSNVFGLEPRPSQASEKELWDNEKFIRPALIGKVKNSALDAESQPLWDATLEEAENNHWMSGPHTVEQVHDIFKGQPWIPVRRFGVLQSSGDKIKLRPIDDFAENKVNSAYGYSDKLDLRTLDQIVWVTAAITRAVMIGRFCFRKSDGALLQGEVHPGYLADGGGRPLLSVLDLSSAYKQFAIYRDCRRLSVITLKDPADKACKCFIGNVLPFGATASVVHFNRVSRLIHSIGLSAGLIWGNYFDDFPMVTPGILGQSSMSVAKLLLDMLGFQYADHKLKPFATKATVLGVEIDAAESGDGHVLIRNKPGRVEEISETVDGVLARGTLTAKEASRVLGRIQFADAQVMGRVGRIAMHEFRLAIRMSESVTLDPSAAESLRVLMGRLASGKPRLVPCCDQRSPILVFTDGASESDGHTIGGVIYLDGRFEYFSCAVPESLVAEWGSMFSHFIGLVELYAVLVSRRLWSDQITGSRTIYFIDNNSSMDACIRGTSGSKPVRELLLCWERMEEKDRSWPWFTRVPSQSNPADEPSRSCHDLMGKLGALRRGAVCPVTGVSLVDL